MAFTSIALAALLLGRQEPKTTFDQAAAWKWLTKQCDLGPRVPNTSAHVKCRDIILDEVKKDCDSAELQPFGHVWSRDNSRRQMWNVIGYQNWENATTRVVLLTHWDTRPTADQEIEEANRAKPIPGANDGASGTAVLLELMRHTHDVPKSLGICYLFVDGEDLGPGLDEMFLGATYFAQHLPKHKPDYGILIDMIGDADLQIPVEPNSYNRARKLTLALYRHAKDIGMSKTFPMEQQGEIYDDHLSFLDAGIPTVDFIDFTYDPWHTLRDTPDKCSAESLGKVGKFLNSWVHQPDPWKPN
ncbi:MAG: M28 family peptidase [Armatimonadetes bacterium]|nr:M28 family peptidase [Armatimonadota bacterium]